MSKKHKTTVGYIVLAAVLVGGTTTLWGLSSSGEDATRPAASTDVEIVVYKSPTCGCCEAWIEHMEQAGFSVEVKDRHDVVALKQRLGVPTEMFSCHTAVINGKVVEGHVPASTVERYLADGSPGDGLAVPGMPPGSPGMPSLSPQPYEVFTFEGDRTTVYESR